MSCFLPGSESSPSVAMLQIVPDEPVCIERFTDFRAFGRIALREGGKTIAVGIVTRILEQK